MTKQQQPVLEKLTLKDVPMVRRHVYFYIVLLLTTTLLHNTVWTSSPCDASLEAVKAGEKVAEVQHELALAETRFAP